MTPSGLNEYFGWTVAELSIELMEAQNCPESSLVMSFQDLLGLQDKQII